MGTSLVAQWLRVHTPNARGQGLVQGIISCKMLLDPACYN